MAKVAKSSRARRGGSKPGERRGGRKKGTPNKLTKSAKEAFCIAFDEAGGAEGLSEWAREHQTEFYKLYARLIPVDTHLSGGLDVELRQMSDEQLDAEIARLDAEIARQSD